MTFSLLLKSLHFKNLCCILSLSHVFCPSLSVQTHGLYLDQKILSIPMSLAVISAVISSYQQVRISNQYTSKCVSLFSSRCFFLSRCVRENARARTHTIRSDMPCAFRGNCTMYIYIECE